MGELGGAKGWGSLRTVSKRLHCALRFRHPHHSVLGAALPSDSPEAEGPGIPRGRAERGSCPGL